MTKITLGVIDVPYEKNVADQQKRVRSVRTKAGRIQRKIAAAPTGGLSTGDVAEILEAEYHVMEIFYELHQQDIADTLGKVIENSLADAIGGAPLNRNATVEASSRIEAMFVKFIDSQGMDGIQPKVPTKAAIDGVNHRLKHPYAKNNPTRPSFRDTGLYEASFHVEVS